VACGGDGTVHEVVNGMLAREDRLRVPVGIIPNGTGNGVSCGLGMRNS
jgi:diacylglycerol kinase family enzyme